jgi:hypothetical protein
MVRYLTMNVTLGTYNRFKAFALRYRRVSALFTSSSNINFSLLFA